jgi:hypothetical protein
MLTTATLWPFAGPPVKDTFPVRRALLNCLFLPGRRASQKIKFIKADCLAEWLELGKHTTAMLV